MTSVASSTVSWTTYGAGAVDWDGGATDLVSSDTNWVHTIAQASAGNTTLRCKSFGISGIPGGSTILGVQVDLYGHAAHASRVYDLNAILFNGTAGTTADRIGSNKGRGSSFQWSTTNGLINSFGSSSDTWGAALTPAIVQSANFGFDLDVKATINDDCYVDRIVLTVTYINSSTGTISVVESSDTVTISGTGKASATLSVTELADSFSSTGLSTLLGQIAIFESGDAIDASAAGFVHASISISEVADALAASGALYQPIIPGRNATWTLIGSPGATLIEHGQPRATIVERGPAAAGF